MFGKVHGSKKQRSPPLAGSSHGKGGIRTLDTRFSPYNGLANRRLQPLGHLPLRENTHDLFDLARRDRGGVSTRPREQLKLIMTAGLCHGPGGSGGGYRRARSRCSLARRASALRPRFQNTAKTKDATTHTARMIPMIRYPRVTTAGFFRAEFLPIPRFAALVKAVLSRGFYVACVRAPLACDRCRRTAPRDATW